MKRFAFALACVAVFAPGCGGGTLGKSGTGASGVLPPDGAGGNFIAGAGAAGGAASGIGGDGLPPPTGVGGFGGGCPPSSYPVCGPQCGNGVIDTCSRAAGPECLLETLTEDCDGYQLGTDSCTARGFGSGTLTCNYVCAVDDGTCSDCVPTGGGLIDCRPPPIVFPNVTAFGIAATDAEIGLAQIDENVNTYTSRLTFARLDSKLGLINAVGLEDTAQPGPLQGSRIEATAVAATSSGWLIAGCGFSSDGFVHAVDPNGNKVGRAVVPDIGCLGMLSLVPSQAGGPTLLLWRTYYNAVAALVGADLSVGPPMVLGFLSGLVGGADAVWIGDAFYVVVPISGAISVLRIAADGTTTVVADILKGEQQSLAPTFARGATDMRLIYSGLPVGQSELDYAVLWRRLGSSGELLGPPVTLGVSPYFARLPALAFGDDTVILLNGADREELAIIGIDKDGKIVKLPYNIAMSPQYSLSQFDMVRRGTEIVVGWLHPSGASMKLARVTP